VLWLEPAARRRRRRRLPPRAAALALLVALAGGGLAAAIVAHQRSDHRRSVAQRFAGAWARGDLRAMWGLLDADSRKRYPLARFSASYRSAQRAATAIAVRVGRADRPRDGVVTVPVAVSTRLFGTLRGTIGLPMARRGSRAFVAWRPEARLPGLRPGEPVRRRVLVPVRRASVFAADGRPLDQVATAASILGRAPSPGDRGFGLEAMFDARLGGRPGAELLFGRRLIVRVPAVHGRSVHATISPGLQAAATAALGSRLGGLAVLRPRDGAVLALAGLAVSAPQPPGSTFKIVTLSAVLRAGLARPSSVFPVRTFAVLSGVRLRNASDEACGGTLANAFAVSCNSVFAPLGARLGGGRLVRAAEAFGFNERPRVPAARPSTIPPASALKDSLAVGASAIGQDKDLATPLEMASAGAAIGERGVRAKPRIALSQPVIRHRAAPASVARQVRTMMLGVVSSGTGRAAAIPGVEVAGKTGTAELRPTAGGPPDPKDTDAWFVAFAPASAPRVAVAVMLVGAGAGGKAAAPIARQVLQAALAGGGA
jgi:penicillin-binding protein A